MYRVKQKDTQVRIGRKICLKVPLFGMNVDLLDKGYFCTERPKLLFENSKKPKNKILNFLKQKKKQKNLQRNFTTTKKKHLISVCKKRKNKNK